MGTDDTTFLQPRVTCQDKCLKKEALLAKLYKAV